MPLSRKTLLAAVALIVGSTLLTAYGLREARERPDRLRRTRMADLESAGTLYLIYREHTPVGLYRLQLNSTEDSVVVAEEMELHLTAPDGRSQNAYELARQVLDANLRLQRLHFEVEAGGGITAAQNVTIDGHRTDPHTLSLEVETGGRIRTVALDAPPNLVFGAGVWPRLTLGGRLESGQRLRLPEFDPIALDTRTMRIEVGEMAGVAADVSDRGGGRDDQVRAYPVTQRVGGVTYDVLVSEFGMPVKAELPLGLVIERATLAEASAARRLWARQRAGGAGQGDVASNLIVESVIGAGLDVTNLEARSATRAHLHVRSGALPEGAEGGSQRVSGDTVTVERVPLPPVGRAGYRLGSGGGGLPDSLAAYLEAAPYVEAGHPDVRRAARTAADGATDPVVAVRRVTRWVYETLDKRYTASLPSAVEALRAGEGDCNEHTLLATAMLRHLGVPTRAVSGVALVDGGFYFHAWPEVWLGGRWVPVDPTFGLVPADPARLRLYVGSSRMHAVVALLGELDLDVLSLAS